jgi:PLP dependent protein
MIRNNLRKIQEHIATIARECGRSPDDIQLVAVSKTVSTAAIREAIEAGQHVFGENYIQEAQQKISELNTTASFHFIGHLQSNKAKTAAEIFDVIETIDRFKLAAALSRHLVSIHRTVKILVQVNIGNEDQKSGVVPNYTEQLLRDIRTLPNLKVVGLMAIPPFTETAELARPYFKKMRDLAEYLAKMDLFSAGEKVELSMGMSDDYPVAIAEGATIVRVGTAIFGSRSQNLNQIPQLFS